MGKSAAGVPTLLGYAELVGFVALARDYANNRRLVERAVRESARKELEDRLNSAHMSYAGPIMEPLYPMPGYLFKSDYVAGSLKEVTLKKMHLQSLEMPVRELYGLKIPLGLLVTTNSADRRPIEFELGNEAVRDFEMNAAAFQRQRRDHRSSYFWDVRSEEFKRRFPVVRAVDGR